MINERSLTTKLVTQITTDLRGSLTQKHAGGLANSVPDLSTSWLGDTWWIENKFLRPGEQLKDIVTPKQLIKAHQLHVTTNGKCIYTIYEEHHPSTRSQQLHLMTPAAVARRVWPKMVFGTNYVTVKVADPDRHDLWSLLQMHGHILVEGWQHRAVTKLIIDHARTHARKGVA